MLFFGVLLICVSSSFVIANSDGYTLNILHYNDFHARFVETAPSGSVCNPTSAPCIGGFARLTTLIRQRLAEEPDSLLLNGGDNFQGTIWYNMLRWNVTQEFMNRLPHDAFVLGNHEFDNGISGLVPFLQHLNAPVVTANIIDDLEPTIQGLYQPSIVIEKNGRNIGIIGVITSTTPSVAVTGNLKFTDEVETVKTEAEKLHAQGIDIIVVLSHSGLDIDKEIALNGGPYIDVIVGAHSHSLLYNGNPPSNSAFEPEGPYPVVVEQDYKKVLIVQAGAHTQYLGELKVNFDNAGNIINWEGNPHFIGNEVEQAEDILALIDVYLPQIEQIASEEIGQSMVDLSSNCTCRECNLGNFICDAYLDSALDLAEEGNWQYAHFCILVRGGIRADIPKGVITYETVAVTTPFENYIEVFDLRGDFVMELLEYAVANIPWPGARMVQMSGLRVVYDGSMPLNSRVLNATIRCIDCDVPRYEPLQLDKVYRVVTQDFMGEGGDGFTMLSEHRQNVKKLGLDYVILMDYIRKRTPVLAEVDGRIQISNPCLS